MKSGFQRVVTRDEIFTIRSCFARIVVVLQQQRQAGDGTC